MGGRAVEGSGLENRQGATPRGFESHPIRQIRHGIGHAGRRRFYACGGGQGSQQLSPRSRDPHVTIRSPESQGERTQVGAAVAASRHADTFADSVSEDGNMAYASASSGASAAGAAGSCRRSSHARRDTTPSTPAAAPRAPHCGRSCCALRSARRAGAGSPAASPPSQAGRKPRCSQGDSGPASCPTRRNRPVYPFRTWRITSAAVSALASSTAAPALFTTQIAVASTPTSSPAKYVMAELRCRLGRDCDPRWTRITTEDCRLRPRASVWRIPARHAKLVCACSPCAMLQRKSAPLLLAGCCPRAISQRQPHMRNQGMLGI